MSRSQIFDDNQLLVYAQQSVTPHKGYRIQSHKTVQSVRASMNGPRQQS